MDFHWSHEVETELADRIGITQTPVSDYERGRARPPAEMLIHFAKVLEVSLRLLIRSAPRRSAF